MAHQTKTEQLRAELEAERFAHGRARRELDTAQADHARTVRLWLEELDERERLSKRLGETLQLLNLCKLQRDDLWQQSFELHGIIAQLRGSSTSAE